jgi:type I restriction enzyme S subunit
MRFAPYPKYKPSGVEWLGEVPEHWEVKRLKRAVTLTDRKVEADQENPVPYIGMENIESWTGRLLPINADTVPTGTANEFKAGNTLFGKLRPYLAKACIPDFDGLCSTELLVLEGAELDRRALLYLLLADGFVKLVDSSTYGSKMPRASWDFVGDCVVPIASADEHRAIADFLDREMAKIDTLLAKKRTLIERLKEKRTALISRTVTRGLPPDAARAAGLDPHPKLKPSGIDWLGDVPEHWTVKAIKWESPVLRGASPRPIDNDIYFDDDGEYAWVRIADVSAAGMYLHETTQRLSPLGQSLSVPLQPGALFLSIAGSVGKPCITAIKCCIHDGFVYFPFWRGEARFLYYLFASGEPYKGLGKLGTQLNLNTDTVGSIVAGFPTRLEQRAIADFLDRETAKIDTMIAKVETAIERLLEYRTALITAAVTGKIDVRGLGGADATGTMTA